MLMSLIIILVILALVIVFVTWPLFKDDQSTQSAIFPTDSYEEILQQIRDLEFDHQFGKVSEDDYPEMREALVIQAARALSARQIGKNGKAGEE